MFKLYMYKIGQYVLNELAEQEPLSMQTKAGLIAWGWWILSAD